MTNENIEESLAFFPCGESSLAGILTHAINPNGLTIVTAWGAGPFPSSGRNQVRTRLARIIAGQGFHAFRFDYLGVGESDGRYQRTELSQPNTEEIVAACEWLKSRGLHRVVIVANCFGGWSSLMAAPNISGLEGMAIMNAPVWRDHKAARGSWSWWAARLKRLRLRKLLSSKHRAAYKKLLMARASSLFSSRSKAKGSSEGPTFASQKTLFSGAVGFLLSRNIPVLLLYGHDDFRADLEAELESGLRPLIENADPPTRVVMVSEQLAKSSLEAQYLMLDELVPWLREIDHSRKPVKQ